MDTFHCTPHIICADLAFQSTEVQDFFRRVGINPLSTGPYTPGPNRAEAAVRVFKATLHDLCAQIGTFTRIKSSSSETSVKKKSCSSEELHGDV